MSEKPKFNPFHANSNNPNNHAFWQEKGYEKRPKNWKILFKKMNSQSNRQKNYIEADGGYTDPFWKDDY